MRKLAHAQVPGLPTLVLATDREIACLLVDSATVLFGLGPATSTICQGTQEESHSPMSQVTGPLTLVLDLDPVVAHDAAPVPLSPGLGAVLLPRDLLGGTPVFAPRGRPADLGPTADLEVVL